MRNVARSLVVLFALLAQPTATLAQDSAITGQVLDTNGDVLPGVTVEATDSELSVAPPLAVTDGQGRYTVGDLPRGTYTVTFRLPGFGSVVRNGVEVATELPVRLDVPMIFGVIDPGITISISSPSPTTRPGPGILLNCVVSPSGTVGGCRRSVVTPSVYR